MSSARPDEVFNAPEFGIDRLRLVFVDREQENAYTREALGRSLGFSRAFLVAGALLYAAFGTFDVAIGGNSVYILWFVRGAVVCPVLIAVLALTYHRAFLCIGQYALAAAMLVAGLGIVAMTAVIPPPFNEMYYADLIMLMVFCSALIRLHVRFSAVVSLALFASYQVVALAINPLPQAVIERNDFFFIVAAGVGLLAAYIRDSHLRRSFISQKIIEAKNRTLNLLFVEADKANKSKSEFLANMSHELRTPLNAVIGFSEMLSRQHLGPLGHARYGEYVSHINVAGLHLLAIINDILDLAKAETGKLQLQIEECNLVECLKNCILMCREPAERTNVKLVLCESSPALRVLADRRLLFQAVLNLVANAVKFTPPGGTVELRLALTKGCGVEIVVRDTGIGIAPENIERVFVPFEQVESSLARKNGGTGLGLPYAKKLIELHGGTLHLASKVDKGTTVTISLPADRVVSRALKVAV